MSQLLILKKFIPNVKLQSITDQFNHSFYQCWTNIHGLLFWIVSVIINHWKLKEEIKNCMVMDFRIGNQNGQPSSIYNQNTLQQHQNVNELSVDRSQQLKKKKVLPPLIIHTKEKKAIKRKQSFVLVKNQMLSWKQKLSPKSPTFDPQTITVKRSFLQRLGSNNNLIYSDPGSPKSEPPSPTLSILKSISIKLKRQDTTEDMVTSPVIIETSSSKSRLSLPSFKRKTSVDTLK